jgi:transposase
MAQKPIAMEQLKQILQLKKDGVGIREMARRVGISRNSVRKYLSRLQEGELSSDGELAQNAYPNDALELDAQRQRDLSLHFATAEAELSKTGVTRQLLHQEYLLKHPDGYSYSRYCYHLSEYLKNRDLSMHLEYAPADMIMIDFAGKPQRYIDPLSGEVIPCQVFVSILPFSGLIFCIAVPSQRTGDFIHCINQMLRFYGGVTSTILCDNLKTAVVRPSRYEPQFTEVCQQSSEHYNTTFSATRPYSPRDKALVEGAVRIVYSHVYAPLRDRAFTSLEGLNQAMGEQLTLLNNKPYKKTPNSRRYYFEQCEQKLLKALPGEPFSVKKVVMLTVQRNYHVQLSEDHRYYSVPYKYVGSKVKVVYDHRSVEVYLGYERIAVHLRGHHHHRSYTTLPEHMPPHHQRMHQIRGFSREDLLERAQSIGPSTVQAATLMLENSIYIEQNYKACFGMLLLAKKYGASRLEAACERALRGPRVNYTLIKNILERGLDRQLSIEPIAGIPKHDNIRGKDHYQ